MKVLVHHADAEGDGVIGLGHVDLLAADEDIAFILVIEPVEDVHHVLLPAPFSPSMAQLHGLLLA